MNHLPACLYLPRLPAAAAELSTKSPWDMMQAALPLHARCLGKRERQDNVALRRSHTLATRPKRRQGQLSAVVAFKVPRVDQTVEDSGTRVSTLEQMAKLRPGFVQPARMPRPLA